MDIGKLIARIVIYHAYCLVNSIIKDTITVMIKYFLLLFYIVQY